MTKSAVDDSLIYSSSLDGIRVWKVPDFDSIDWAGQHLDEHVQQLSVWDEHNGQPVWKVRHHPHLPLLVSAGADDCVCLWACPTEEEMENDEESTILQRLDFEEVPTSLDWMNTNVNLIAISYARAMVGLVDQKTGNLV